MRIPTPRTRRAARAGARTAASSPDPARAVKAAQKALGNHADRYRVSVSRPAAIGRPARCTVSHARYPIGTTVTREVTR